MTEAQSAIERHEDEKHTHEDEGTMEIKRSVSAYYLSFLFYLSLEANLWFMAGRSPTPPSHLPDLLPAMMSALAILSHVILVWIIVVGLLLLGMLLAEAG